MDFTLKLCEEIFPESRIIRGEEPEFTIARGLAWAWRIDIKTKGFRDATDSLVRSTVFLDKIRAKMPDLCRLLAAKLAETIPEQFILPSFHLWKTGEISTLAELEPVAQHRMAQWLESGEGVTFLTAITSEWFACLRPEVESLTNPICDEFDIDRELLLLPSAVALPGEPPAGMFDPTEVIGGDEVALIGGVIVSAVIATLVGHLAITLLHPVGWLTDFLLAIALLAMGKKRAMKIVSEAEIPLTVRNLVPDEFMRKKLHSKIREFRDQILRSLESDSSGIQRIASETQRAIADQLIRAADVAELMIR